MTMTTDGSMIYKNTIRMTNSSNTPTMYPVMRNGELVTTVFSPKSDENSFLLMDTETHFNHNGIQYLSAHHYMIAEVASIMADNDMANVIRDVRSITSLITLEDRIINANDTRFEDVKTDLFFNANYYKFLGSSTQRQKLLATGSTTILNVHQVPGLDVLRNEMVYSNRDTIGGNCLGMILMEIRDTIKDRMSSTDLI
jgi:predicted NAD-dependent protein-ADP-ribosyltransferase YbiA (DUF1768 family)